MLSNEVQGVSRPGSDAVRVPVIEPLHFEQIVVHVVSRWPEWTTFTPEWLEYAHVHKAMVSGDKVTINADNGTAVYRLRRDLPMYGDGIMAELVDGDTPGRLKQRAAKYRPSEEEGALDG